MSGVANERRGKGTSRRKRSTNLNAEFIPEQAGCIFSYKALAERRARADGKEQASRDRAVGGMRGQDRGAAMQHGKEGAETRSQLGIRMRTRWRKWERQFIGTRKTGTTLIKLTTRCANDTDFIQQPLASVAYRMRFINRL